ncbi:MAG TPA: FIST N-terminal domain-containing protein [Acidothermaceae bacterium]|nr:FIST N-terminal domain-containing protein [Acidothermaceae bacterium]
MGSHALNAALAGRTPALVIAFASSELDLGLLVEDLRGSVEAQTPVVGCTTAGEISSEGPTDGGVVVVALGGADFSVATAVAENVDAGLRDAGALVAESVSRLDDRPHRVLLLLTDGLAGDQQEIVRGAYSIVGAQVPLVGGCAGDDQHMKTTSVFYDGRVLTNAIVGVAIGSTSPFGIGVRHGWRRVGEPILVTGSVGTQVLTLDDEPALDVYLRRLGAPAEAATDQAEFARFAMTHPLGLSRRSGEEVRFIAGADFDDRSLHCIAQVPQGGLAWIMEGNDDSVLSATDGACADALAQLDGHDARGVLAFDCIARRGVLGAEGIEQEVERITLGVHGAPVAGFYSYGEIARTKGTGGFHNQTLVVLAVS